MKTCYTFHTFLLKQLKNEVEYIFNEIGITTSQAINIFLKKVKSERGIPFELKVPNQATINAMKEAKELDGEIATLEEFVSERC